MLKSFRIISTYISASIVINTYAAPNQPVRPSSPVSTTRLTQTVDLAAQLTQVVDQWVKGIKKDLGAFRNVNTDWQHKILEFDSINAKFTECAYMVRPGGELDTLARKKISLCLQRADENAKLAKAPNKDADLVAEYLAAEKTFRFQAGEIRKILDSIHDMHKHFVKCQEKISALRQFYIVMIIAREFDKANWAIEESKVILNDLERFLKQQASLPGNSR